LNAFSLAEDISNLDQAPAETGFDSAQGKPGFFRDLGVGHSFVKVKGENLLGFFGELLEGDPDVFTLAPDSSRCFGRHVGEGFGIRKRLEEGLPVFLAGIVDGAAPGEHSDKGRFGCRCRIETVGRLPKVREGFLDDVFRRGMVLGVSPGDGPNKATVSSHALFHGVFISLGDLLKDPNVGFNLILIVH